MCRNQQRDGRCRERCPWLVKGISRASRTRARFVCRRVVPGTIGPALTRRVEDADHSLYHATMPRLSATCTESLTPFVSLMPCASRAGLSSLLNPHQLFDSEFTLIGVHYVRDETSGRFTFNVGSVADPVRKHRLAGGMGKRGKPRQTGLALRCILIAIVWQIFLCNPSTIVNCWRRVLSPAARPSQLPFLKTLSTRSKSTRAMRRARSRATTRVTSSGTYKMVRRGTLVFGFAFVRTRHS